MNPRYLYHDYETIPGQSKRVRDEIHRQIDEEIAGIKAPGNYKKPESIEKYKAEETLRLNESFSERWQRTGLRGSTGEIISMSLAIDDGEVWAKTRTLDDSEVDLIDEYFNHLLAAGVGPSTIWVGFNTAAFDIRFLYQRCVILGYRPPIHLPTGGPGDRGIYDCMVEWAGWGQRISQEAVAAALGLPGKPGMTGADVWPAIQVGEYDKVNDYCRYDCGTIREIHRRMAFL